MYNDSGSNVTRLKRQALFAVTLGTSLSAGLVATRSSSAYRKAVQQFELWRVFRQTDTNTIVTATCSWKNDTVTPRNTRFYLSLQGPTLSVLLGCIFLSHGRPRRTQPDSPQLCVATPETGRRERQLSNGLNLSQCTVAVPSVTELARSQGVEAKLRLGRVRFACLRNTREVTGWHTQWAECGLPVSAGTLERWQVDTLNGRVVRGR